MDIFLSLVSKTNQLTERQHAIPKPRTLPSENLVLENYNAEEIKESTKHGDVDVMSVTETPDDRAQASYVNWLACYLSSFSRKRAMVVRAYPRSKKCQFKIFAQVM